jgi:hypothetical protein
LTDHVVDVFLHLKSDSRLDFIYISLPLMTIV